MPSDKFKKWSLTVLLWVFGGVSAVVLINCIVDTYGILRTDFSRQFQEPNGRFVKIKYLLNHKERYDSFLFGSSRAYQIDTKKIRNGTFYNMAYSEGLPNEHLANMKFLIKNRVPVKNVIIALDDFSYRVDPQNHLIDLLRQPHFLVSGKKALVFYSEYFLKIKRFVPSVRSYIEYNYSKQGATASRRLIYDFYDSGRVLCPACDAEIENNIERHMHDKKFEKPTHYNGNNLENTLSALREIVDLTKSNHINLTLFINPMHKTTYLDTDMAQFLAFKKGLADIADFYDFSGLNSITTNNYYYHETSHYREVVGDMMLRKMFGYPPVPVPADFGVLVTRQNVDAHVDQLRRQAEEAQFSPHTIVKDRTKDTEGNLNDADL